MLKRNFLFISFFFLLTACTTYSNKVTPVPLPTMHNEHVNIENVLLYAQAYVNEAKAEQAFGYDIRGAGLLPVRVVIDNRSPNTVKLLGEQTFLLDWQGQAWPLLTARQANERIQEEVEIGETVVGTAKPAGLMGAAGALAGLAIGVLTGQNVGTTAAAGAVLGGAVGAIYGGAEKNHTVEDDIYHDMNKQSLRNETIKSGALAYGYLFFPGLDEAKSAHSLRLAILINGRQRIINLPLKTE